MICGGAMHASFTKAFDRELLGTVEYVTCAGCGFVASKTHFELPAERWRDLTTRLHGTYQGMESCPEDRNWVQRLKIQAAVIDDLAGLGVLPSQQPWVDYGCGDGKLSDILAETSGRTLARYDSYMAKPGYLRATELGHGSFGFVVTTSVFEHLRDRRSLDAINALVSPAGVLGVHTLVAERIPESPEWFYLLPAHCSFFTNRSMQILFDQWGYAASIYHVEARLWFWLNTDDGRLERTITAANDRPGKERFFYHFKPGFVDYWKLDVEQMLAGVGAQP